MKLSATWKQELTEQLSQKYFQNLTTFVSEEREGNLIYPPDENVFAAFNYTPFENVNIVILGQDPYHGKGQANGLCFSVSDGIKIPPSLRNIFKELESDLHISSPASGNLEKWAKQGVLLLNATLTVREKEPGSHQGKGWEQFTDNVIKLLSEQKENLIFILWGSYAQAKEELIDTNKHAVVKSTHPSPFSAYRGFLGSKPFSKTNELLRSFNKKEIDWKLEDTQTSLPF